MFCQHLSCKLRKGNQSKSRFSPFLDPSGSVRHFFQEFKVEQIKFSELIKGFCSTQEFISELIKGLCSTQEFISELIKGLCSTQEFLIE